MLLVAEDEPKEFRYGVPPEVYPEWREMQRRIGLPQNQILHRLVRFLLAQDEVTQGMILGQLSPREDLMELILKRMAAAEKARPKGGRTFTVGRVKSPDKP